MSDSWQSIGTADRRAWIGRILERKRRGDATLSELAYRMALAAGGELPPVRQREPGEDDE